MTRLRNLGSIGSLLSCMALVCSSKVLAACGDGIPVEDFSELELDTTFSSPMIGDLFTGTVAFFEIVLGASDESLDACVPSSGVIPVLRSDTFSRTPS